ncbi:NACHT domain-containing protein [Streptomyces sp. LARHCF249]
MGERKRGGRRRPSNDWLVVVGGLGLAVVGAGAWAAGQLARGGQDPADTSSIVSMVVSVAGLLVAVVALRTAILTLRQPDDARKLAEGAADTLKDKTAGEARKTLAKMVGDTGVRLNLTYVRRPYDRLAGTAPPYGQLKADESGQVPGIASYYQQVSTGRLVITGPPGAGKTVLSLQLLVDLVRLWAPGKPVPVRLSLAEWSTDVPFEEFLTERLIEEHAVTPVRADWIVEHGLLVPILDGLDEMDPGLTGVDGTPLYDEHGRQLPDPRAPRALAALKALNKYGDIAPGRPLILVCRTNHYDALPTGQRLWHATAIDIEPIGRAHVAAHLASLFDDDPRWRTFLHDLPAHWTGVLGRALSTPWWLFLVQSVYAQGDDPAHLLTYTTEPELKDHLLSRFIPAVVAQRGGGYEPDRVRHWLGTIARHLQAGPDGVERVDIHRQRLWWIGGEARVRALDAATVGLLFLLLVPAVLASGLPDPRAMVATVCLAAAFTAFEVFRYWADPACVAWGRVFSGATTTFALDGLIGGFVFAALGAVAALPVAWLLSAVGLDRMLVFFPLAVAYWAVWWGISIVIGSGITEAHVARRSRDTNTAVRWQYVFRGDLIVGFFTAVVTAVSVWVAWWVMSLSDLLHVGPAPGVDLIFMGVLAGAMQWVQVFGGGRRYGVFMLCLRRGALPLKLGQFLDWSYKGGLLRTSGGAYQFRHREFQKWLATTDPPSSPASSSSPAPADTGAGDGGA